MAAGVVTLQNYGQAMIEKTNQLGEVTEKYVDWAVEEFAATLEMLKPNIVEATPQLMQKVGIHRQDHGLWGAW